MPLTALRSELCPHLLSLPFRGAHPSFVLEGQNLSPSVLAKSEGLVFCGQNCLGSFVGFTTGTFVPVQVIIL